MLSVSSLVLLFLAPIHRGHNVTALYMLVSTSFSVYLGWVSLATSSLISPIVAHALYDLIAFYQVIRLK